MTKPTLTLLALALALASGAPLAQAPAPAATAPSAPPPVIAQHTCEKPEFPGRSANERRIQKWSTDFRSYVDCLKAYIGERNATIEANSKAAKTAVEEFNTSVTEFNETIKTLNN